MARRRGDDMDTFLTVKEIQTEGQRYIRATAVLEGLSAVLLTVAFILFLIFTATPQLKGKEKILTVTEPTVLVDCINPYTIANSTVCNKTTDCLQGFLKAPDNNTCTYFPRPNNVTDCESPCFPNRGTHCDGAGQCIGPPESCVGSCFANGDCNEIPMEDDVTSFYSDPVTLWIYSGLFGENGICFNGMCIQLFIDLYIGTTTYPLFVSPSPQKAIVPLAAHIFCRDYVDRAYYLAHKECLQFERHSVDQGVLNYTQLEDELSPGELYANASFPVQVSVCLITFTCGQTYRASSPTPTPGKRRSLVDYQEQETWHQRGEKPGEAWGFRPHPHPEETPKPGPILGIPYPEQRQELWSFMQRSVTEEVGPKLIERMVEKIKTERSRY